jgi:hypothetical protein
LNVIESHIFHKPDNAALGIVIYQPLYSPLPIKLLSFSALRNNRNVVVNWQTTSEINNAYFDIERSEDGRNFYPVGKVIASGTATTNHSYSFTDLNIPVQNKVVYYRLKQVDKDGAFSYSKTVAILIDKAAANISIFPNPVKDVFTLSIAQSGTEKITYSLSALDGRRLIQQSNSIIGSTVLTIDALAAQPAGTYILQVWVGSEYKLLKINKL